MAASVFTGRKWMVTRGGHGVICHFTADQYCQYTDCETER